MSLITKLSTGIAAVGIGLSTLTTPSFAGGRKISPETPAKRLERERHEQRMDERLIWLGLGAGTFAAFAALAISAPKKTSRKENDDYYSPGLLPNLLDKLYKNQ